MKKPLKITLISIITFVLFAGIAATIYYFCRPKGQPRDEIKVNPADNTIIDDNTKNIAECSPTESLFILASNLKKLNSYYATLSGEVNALFAKQNISGEKFKADENALYISKSTGAKTTADQIFISSDTVLIRKGDPNTDIYEDTVTKYTLTDYLNEYGTDFRELSNYELNENTITKAELVSAENEIYTYRYEIDIETGVDNYRKNMAKMGNLNEAPTLTKSTLEIAITEDFMPISITQIDEYNVYGIIPCKSTLVEKFEKMNDNSVVIPEHEFFKAYIID